MPKQLRSPSNVDRHVGRQLRARRNQLGMSQTDAGNVIGVSFQQIQKYEKGTNRLSAGHLYQLSQTFDVPVGYFFRGLNA